MPIDLWTAIREEMMRMADIHKSRCGDCTVVRHEGDHRTWIFFDPRVNCVAKGSAGGYFKEISTTAHNVRMSSGYKYTVNLADIDDGVIEISKNLAIENGFHIQGTIALICGIVNSARIQS